MRCAVLLLLGALQFDDVTACVCHWPAEFSNYELSFDILNETPLIVRATVVDTVNPTEGWLLGTPQLVHLSVSKTYKGKKESTLLIYNRSYSSNCDHGYQIGQEYLLFLQPDTSDGNTLAFCSGVIDISLEHQPQWEARLGRLLKQLEIYGKDPMNPLQVKYSNGQPMAQGKVVNGLPEGHWRIFTYDGQVELEGEFANGKRVGVWKKLVDPRMEQGHWGPGMEPKLTKPMVADFDRGVQMSYWTSLGEEPIPIAR